MSPVDPDTMRETTAAPAVSPPTPPAPPPIVDQSQFTQPDSPDQPLLPPGVAEQTSNQLAAPPLPPESVASSNAIPSQDSVAHSMPSGIGVQPAPMDAVMTSSTDDESDVLGTTVRASPPWLVSCVVHMALVVILAFIPYLVEIAEPPVKLVVGKADALGEQLELETESDDALLEPTDFQIAMPDDIQVVDPMSAVDPLPIVPDGVFDLSTIDAPKMGAVLSGREEGMKDILLAAYGGSGKTESAVLAGLRWLAKHQDSDGAWSLSGRHRADARSKIATYPDGGFEENKSAATALAMLAFQGYGQTHLDGPDEAFQKVMERAVKGLLRRQATDGSFTRYARNEHEHLRRHHLMYTQAMCAFALSELYALTKDSSLRGPAQKAIDFLVENQHRHGGWKYQPGSGSDLSVTGWVMMALQSARMGGLEVPHKTLYNIERFLDKVAHVGGRRYAYDIFRKQWSLAMTAEGLLCRQYLGWTHDDERMIDGVELLVENPISFRGDYRDVYYWYYATQVVHNMPGDYWRRWNTAMKRELVARQENKGEQLGSWSPEDDAWAEYGGRLYTTCLSIFMLEVYYRHLPIYSQNFGFGLDKEEPEDF
jgi:hypothetical protein